MGPVVALLAGATIAVASQWGSWERDPLSAILGVFTIVAFLVAGAVVGADPDQRRNGRLFTLFGLTWAVISLSSWVPAPLAAAGVLLSPLYVLIITTLLLRYPADRLGHRYERAFVVATFCWFEVLNAILTFSPWLATELGHADPADLPPPVFDERIAELATQLASGSAVVVGAVFAFLVALRFRRARGLDRQELVPVAVAAVAAGLSGGVACLAEVVDVGRPDTLAVVLQALPSAALLAVPVAFGVVAVRRRLAHAAVADVVVGLSPATTVEGVRERLRQALCDPGLEVLYWMPGDGYVDAAGRRVDPPSDDGRGSCLAVPVPGSDGEPLALVLADPSLRRHGGLLKAAVRAAALALENARLQAGIRSQLAQVRASRARIVEAGLAERRRLERDLHDGAQQRLLALTMQMAALRTRAADDTTRHMVDALRGELRSALDELRDLARGLHPAVLGSGGLRPALESVAERLPLRVRLDVPDRRWSPAAEAAAYFFACEGLTNAVKHAHAKQARVTVGTAEDRLDIEVADDGIGGALATPGSGLAGLADRVEGLGGAFTVHSRPGRGTRIFASIPCGPTADRDRSADAPGAPDGRAPRTSPAFVRIPVPAPAGVARPRPRSSSDS